MGTVFLCICTDLFCPFQIVTEDGDIETRADHHMKRVFHERGDEMSIGRREMIRDEQLRPAGKLFFLPCVEVVAD